MGHNTNGNMHTGVHDKLGRVFVRNSEKEYIEVEGAKFSNIQLRIYRGSVEDDTFNGCKYSFGLLGNRFNVPIPLGMNVPVSTKNVNLAYEREVEVARQLKLLNDEDEPDEYRRKCKIIEESKMSLFWTLTSPTKDMLEQDFLLETGPFTYIDDLLENLGGIDGNGDVNDVLPENKKSKLPYEFTSRISGYLCQAILKEVDNDDADPFADILNDPSRIVREILGCENDHDEKPVEKIMVATNDKLVDFYEWVNFIVGFLSFLRREALKTGKRTGCSTKAFLEHVADVMDMFCLEFSKEWYAEVLSNPGRKLTMVPSIVTLRKGTAGGVLFLETILLQSGIEIDDDLRRSTLFKLILNHLLTHVQKVNEVISFEKEMEGNGIGWRDNEACLLHKVDGMSILDAKVKIAEEANQALEQINRLSKFMLKLYSGKAEEETIVKFTKIVMQIITGHMQWTLLVDRYHQGASADCYIH